MRLFYQPILTVVFFYYSLNLFAQTPNPQNIYSEITSEILKNENPEMLVNMPRETDDAKSKFYRWEQKMRPKLNKDGSFPDVTPMLLGQIKIANERSFAKNMVEMKWKSLGPNHAPNGIGRINTLAFHPTDTMIIFAGAPAGGFWKTTNGGRNWRTTTDHISSIGVSSIAVNPNNPDTIYIGTGDKDLWDCRSIGVLRSVDMGETWQATGLIFPTNQPHQIGALVIDPTATNRIYATSMNEIYKSENSGQSWIKLNAPLGVSEFYQLMLNPFDTKKILLTGKTGRVWRSVDTGGNWQEITQNIPYPDISKIENAWLAFSPVKPNYVVLSSQGEPNNNINAGIYISNDYGDTFTKIANNANEKIVNWFGYVVAVSPTNPDEIYVAGGFTYRSLDRGKTFVLVHQAGSQTNDGTFIHVDQHYLGYRSNGDFFVGCDGGISMTKKGRLYWEDLNGDLAISELYGFGSSELDSNFIVMGAQDIGSGSLISQKYNIRFGGDGMEVLIDPTDDKTFYLSSQLGYIDKTVDGGKNFVNFISTPVTNEGGAWTTPFLLYHTNPNKTAYAAYQNVWKTNDGGKKWQKLGSISNDVTVRRVAVAASDSNVIYVMKEWGYGMFRTTNHGGLWEKIEYPQNAPALDNITISITNPMKIWATALGYNSGQKVYYSSNGGKTWENVSGTLPNVICNSILYQPNSKDRIFVGTENGVYYKDTLMKDWALLGQGLPNTDVKKLEYVSKFNKLRAGTYGRGLWEISLNELDKTTTVNEAETKENINKQIIFSAYPNPSNSSFNIHLKGFNNPQKLVLANLLGEQIDEFSLVNVGEYFSVDLSKLISGTYVLIVKGSEKSVCIKLKKIPE